MGRIGELTPEEVRQFEIGRPEFRWRDSGWWLSACGTGVAIVTILVPSLAQYPIIIRIAIAVFSLFVAPVAVIAVMHLGTLVSVSSRRALLYQRLHAEYQATTDKLNAARETILALQDQLGTAIEIDRVQYYKNEIYIVIRKKRGMKLESGALLAVIDTTDGMVMGRFKITEALQHECTAIRDGYVDPLWGSYVGQVGQSEMHAPPHTVALLVTKEDSDNDAQK